MRPACVACGLRVSVCAHTVREFQVRVCAVAVCVSFAVRCVCVVMMLRVPRWTSETIRSHNLLENNGPDGRVTPVA